MLPAVRKCELLSVPLGSTRTMGYTLSVYPACIGLENDDIITLYLLLVLALGSWGNAGRWNQGTDQLSKKSALPFQSSLSVKLATCSLGSTPSLMEEKEEGER